MRTLARRLTPWALCLLGYVLFFGALFSPVWAGGSTLAVGDALYQAGPACYGPHGLWTTGIYLGYPLVADPTQLRFYPLNALCPMPGALEVLIASPFALAAFGMTGFVRALTGSWTGAVASGFAYALGGFAIAHAGHVPVATPAAWAPFVLWAFEALRRQPVNAPAFAGASIATALCILGGQPQAPLFALTLAVAFAAARALGTPQAARYLPRCAAALALGVALAAVQLVPEIELYLNSARRSISYDAFVAGALAPAELAIRLAFPYLLGDSASWLYPLSSANAGAFTEAANSSGLPLLAAATAGALAPRTPLRWFWIGVALLGWALSLGPLLGLSYLTYHLPLYSLVRHPGFHAFEGSFALAVLAGYGVAAVERGTLGARKVAAAAAFSAVAALVAWLAFADGGAAHAASLDTLPAAEHLNPLHNPALGIPLLGWACALAALWWAARRPAARPRALTYAVVVSLAAVAFAEGGYWSWGAPPRSAFAPPKLATQIAGVLTPVDARLLAQRGVADRALDPNLTLLWGVPTVAADLPLVPGRLQTLLDFTPQGAVQPDTFAARNASIVDLVGARLILVEPDFVESAETSAQPFGQTDLAVFLGGRGIAPLQSIAFRVGVPIRANRLALLDTLGFAAEIPQGTTVGEVIVDGARGSRRFPLRAGIETAEAAYDRPDVRPRLRHRAAKTVRSADGFRVYETDLPLSPDDRARDVTIRRTYRDPQNGAISVYGVALVDDRDGTALALGPMSYLRSDPSHWRRLVMQGTDVYDDARALPRAWIPRRVRSGDDAAALAAMRAARGGVPSFDGRDVAFVDERGAALDGVRGTATVERVDDESMTVRAQCAAPCLLVTSDLWYPGWNAAVDGAAARVLRVDVALRGVRLAGGAHTVTFRYAPLSLRLGALGSTLAAIVLALIAGLSLRRKPARVR